MGCRISRVSELRGYGSFRDFKWPEHLREFGRYNLIYGWNGTGKTLLSDLLAALEMRQQPSTPHVKLEVTSEESSQHIKAKDFADPDLPISIRVFNRSFINRTVYLTTDNLKPIYVFGEKSKEARVKLESVRTEIESQKRELDILRRQYMRAKRAFDNFCTQKAKKIAQTLNFTGRLYESDRFRQEMENHIGEADWKRYALDDQLFGDTLRDFKADRLRRLKPPAISHLEDLSNLHERVTKLCQQSLAMTVLNDLEQRPELRVWIEEGLRLHRHYQSSRCLFCRQPLPEDRLKQLEAHFSKQWEDFVDQVESLLHQIADAEAQIRNLSFVDEVALYPGLRERYRQALKRWHQAKDQYLTELRKLERSLAEKRKNPFKDLAPEGTPKSPVEAAQELLEIINDHNDRVDRHDQEIERLRDCLRRHLLSAFAGEYIGLAKEVRGLDDKCKERSRQIAELEAKSKQLERLLYDHQRAAKWLNDDLRLYLGHDELQFEAVDTGYRLLRGEQPADRLSESETTAVALLYFLRSLSSHGFDLSNSIVVLDDPVSSMDSNSLFCALGFIRERLKGVGQLLVLTHNFQFFRQVRYWFRNELKKEQPKNDVSKKSKDEPARYYMLRVERTQAGRSSVIDSLPKLLTKHDSEYHYLFALVWRAAESPGDLEQSYNLPNVSRRLLEAFLEFKLPGSGQTVGRKLEQVSFEQARKIRIARFCDAYSHNLVVDGVEYDPTQLTEAQNVAKDIMDLIQTLDKKHYDLMCKLATDSMQ